MKTKSVFKGSAVRKYIENTTAVKFQSQEALELRELIEKRYGLNIDLWLHFYDDVNAFLSVEFKSDSTGIIIDFKDYIYSSVSSTLRKFISSGSLNFNVFIKDSVTDIQLFSSDNFNLTFDFEIPNTCFNEQNFIQYLKDTNTHPNELEELLSDREKLNIRFNIIKSIFSKKLVDYLNVLSKDITPEFNSFKDMISVTKLEDYLLQLASNKKWEVRSKMTLSDVNNVDFTGCSKLEFVSLEHAIKYLHSLGYDERDAIYQKQLPDLFGKDTRYTFKVNDSHNIHFLFKSLKYNEQEL